MSSILAFCDNSLLYACRGMNFLTESVMGLGEKIHPGYKIRVRQVAHAALYGVVESGVNEQMPNLRQGFVDALIGTIVAPIFGVVAELNGVIFLMHAPIASIRRLITLDFRGAVDELARVKTIVKTMCLFALNFIPAFSFVLFGVYASRTEANPANPQFRQIPSKLTRAQVV